MDYGKKKIFFCEIMLFDFFLTFWPTVAFTYLVVAEIIILKK